jgi:hypothetical protein
MEYGHEIWYMEHRKFAQGRFASDSIKRIIKLHLMRVQEVKLEGHCTEPTGEYIFFSGKGNENHEVGSFFFFL